MEKERIIYFTLSKEKKACFWEKLFGQKLASRFLWIRKKDVVTEKRLLSCKGRLEGTEVIAYILPIALEALRTNTHIQMHTKRLIEHILSQHAGDARYAVLYAEELEESLALRREIDIALMSGIVSEVMLSYHHVEEVILIDGEENPFDILYDIYPSLNRLLIVTDEAERYEDFIDEVYEETGLIVTCQNVLMSYGMAKGMPFVIDMHSDLRIPYRHIPRGAVYVDLCPDGFKRRTIQLKRNDVCYVNCLKFLDSY